MISGCQSKKHIQIHVFHPAALSSKMVSTTPQTTSPPENNRACGPTARCLPQLTLMELISTPKPRTPGVSPPSCPDSFRFGGRFTSSAPVVAEPQDTERRLQQAASPWAQLAAGHQLVTGGRTEATATVTEAQRPIGRARASRASRAEKRRAGALGREEAVMLRRLGGRGRRSEPGSGSFEAS